MDPVAIISIIYKEPEWAQTERCLDLCDCPKFYVDRGGVGSLAKAINSGFKAWASGFEYIWFVTNVTFSPECLPALLREARDGGYAGITPAFNSDHLFCRPDPEKTVTEVPFIEFTAPLVRAQVFREIPLDEAMPYWGHDLDWGCRVRQAGEQLAVLHTQQLGHVYIRNNLTLNRYTLQRRAARRATNGSTRQALRHKYGENWKEVLGWVG